MSQNRDTCQPINQNFHNSNSSGFDQSQTPQFPVIHLSPQETSIETLHDQENEIDSVQTFLRKFNRISFFKTPKVLLLAWDKIFKIKDAFGNKQYKPKDTLELFRDLFNDVQNIREELAEYINTPGWNRPAFYNSDDDDDEDSTIAITSDFLITDSLNMGDKHLDTVLATESNEFIKSSVENLVPNPSESEGENGSDLPACFTTFSNILFDAEYEFDSVDNQPLHNEDFPEEIFSNPLFEEEINSMMIDHHHFNAESDLIGSLLNHDSSIIPFSSKIDSLLDEFVGELTVLKSIPPGIDETDYHPENEILTPTEPVDSLIMEDGHLNTISATKSDEFVKSCVEKLVPTPITISLKIDSLFDEFVDELIFLKSFPPGIDKTDCHPEKEILTSDFLITDSLGMGDEHLDTIPEKESDEFNKSSVEDLVPNPSESEDFSDIENLDSTLKNDRSDTDSYLLESSLNRDTLIDSLLAEFAGALIFLESIPLGVDEANCDLEEAPNGIIFF
nr:hypothetical protein [Tanacetum cinerariifolium]